VKNLQKSSEITAFRHQNMAKMDTSWESMGKSMKIPKPMEVI